MVAPVTGPFVTTVTRSANQPHHSNVAVGRRQRISYRQKRPYSLDLPFTYVDQQILSWVVVSPSPTYAATYDRQDYTRAPSGSTTESQNRAIEDFRNKISSGASWGVTLAERKQAMNMMTSRLIQFTRFVRSMRKFHFGDALRELGYDPASLSRDRWKRLKKRSSSLGDNILEFRFGWQPLWQDIHSTAELLSSDIPVSRVIGKGHSRVSSSADASDPYNYYGYVRRVNIDNETSHVKVWADVVMSNPNAALLNNLGLVNPFLMAYEVIPWSFVANYFISFEQYLRNFNPYAGYTLSNEGYTKYQVINRSSRQDEIRYGSFTGNYAVFKSQSVVVVRTPGTIPSYQLRIRDPWVLKPGRALNAIALLLQQLGKR